MKRILTLAAIASMCALPATSLAQTYGTSSPAPMMMSAGDKITVPMKAQNSSGETGTATLTQKGDDVVVVVKLDKPTSANQPIHIHPGTCANLNPKPQYPLKNVTDGTSTTTLTGMKLSSLQTGIRALGPEISA